MITLIIIGIPLFIITITLAFALWEKQTEAIRNSAVDVSHCKLKSKTPLGVRLRSENPVRAEQMFAIDEYLSKLFQKSRARNYAKKLKHSNYTIYIVPPARTHNDAGKYAPDFYLRADNYDGTMWDRNPTPGVGLITAAEYVFTDFRGFVMPEYVQDFYKAGEAAYNAAEHIVLKFNDSILFKHTATHNEHDPSTWHQIIK